jgi:hypothetical protein
VSALLSRYLKDFGEPAVIAPPAEGNELFDDFGGFSEIAAEPELDVEAERSAAHAQGQAEATATLSEQYELETQTIAMVHQREIEELRSRYEGEIATLLAARIDAMVTDVAELVSATVANVLAPVMTEVLARRAAAELGMRLREAMRDGDACTITVSGPTALFDVLKGQLGEKAGLLRHHETGDIDLSVEFGDSVLVTRMSAWAASLKKVLE